MQTKSASISSAKVFEWSPLWCTRLLFSKHPFPCHPSDTGFVMWLALTSWWTVIIYPFLDPRLDHTNWSNQWGTDKCYLINGIPCFCTHTCLSLWDEHALGICWSGKKGDSGADLNVTRILEPGWAKPGLDWPDPHQHIQIDLMWARHLFIIANTPQHSGWHVTQDPCSHS